MDFVSRRTMIHALAFAVVQRSGGQPTPSERLFTFRQSIWLNLHHFLYVLGRARNNEPDSRRGPVAGASEETKEILDLPEPDRTAWAKAVSTYAASVSKQDLVFDRRLTSLTKTIAGIEDNAQKLPPALGPDVRATLSAAAPIYRRVWWPRHTAANQQRIRELQKLIAQYGNAVEREVSRAYRTQWPQAGFAVNMVAYAQWGGAYSTAAGLIVVGSLDPAQAGTQGLESVFHEAMHQWDDATEAAIREIAKKSGVTAPRSLSHSLIFYTAGYSVAKVVPGHRPYAVVNRLWDRGALVEKDKLDRFWQPYLEGQTGFDEAMEALLKALAG
ncbi:MAG TPA: hypothetical protein VG096_01195 [Bryobacteraceae bacterium]|jgi:hypothetical protein|nr:hypothetical protein [Bryobacteraceae bacterium]